MLPILILTVGLPRSGKTTWAVKSRLPIVCPDAIRLALHGQRYIPELEPRVWDFAYMMVRSLFNAGHDKVVLDACSITRKRRDQWNNSAWETRFKVFTLAPALCMDQAERDKRKDLFDVIRRMADDREPLTPEEVERVYRER